MLIIEIVKVFSVANMQMERCSLQDHGKKRTSNLSGSQPLRIGGVFFSFFFSFSVRGSGVEYLSLSYLLLRLREPRW